MNRPLGRQRRVREPDDAAAFAQVLSGLAFERFEKRMQRQFHRLVRRWIHLAAPDAGALRRMTITAGQAEEAHE